MNFVVIHVLLQFHQFTDNRESFCLFRFQEYIILLQECSNITEITVHILELFLDSFSNLLGCTLFALGKIQIIFSCIFAVHAWFVIIESGTDIINETFEVLTGFIQEIDILRKGYLLWCTRCIQNQSSFVFGGRIITFFAAGSSCRRSIVWCVVSDDHFIDVAKNVIRKAFSKLNQKGWNERLFILIPRKPDEKLIIRILTNLLHQFPVRLLILLLNDQGAKSGAQRLGRHSFFTWKQRSVFFLDLIPRNGSSFFHPTVLWIHFQYYGLIKV